MKLINYSDEFREQVFPDLVPAGYYKKYTSGSFFYKTLRLLRLYKSDLFLLAEDQEITGSILLRNRFNFHSYRFRWFIYGVAIKKEQRGKGLGSIILSYCLEHCVSKRIEEVFLYVDRDNQNAINLYLKHGFEIIEENKTPRRKRRRHSTEYLMRKKLI